MPNLPHRTTGENVSAVLKLTRGQHHGRSRRFAYTDRPDIVGTQRPLFVVSNAFDLKVKKAVGDNYSSNPRLCSLAPIRSLITFPIVRRLLFEKKSGPRWNRC